MAKRKNQSNPMARLMILLVVIGVPVVFILAAMGTNVIVERAPYMILVVMAIVMAVYSGSTSALLYTYFEADAPWYRFIPCFGEFTLIDGKFLKFGVIFYVITLVTLGLSRLPYSVFSFLGEDLAINAPYYLTVVAFAALLIIEVIKGIGLLGCMKVVSSEWEEKMNSSLGFIKLFSWLGFIPFVRVLTIYGLNKPLSTLVTFNDMTVSDTNDVILDEEEEEY